MKIVLLNGPRGSGKDTIASRFLAHTVPGTSGIFPVFHPTKVAALVGAGFEREAAEYAVPEIEKRELKDTPMPKLGDRTPRQVYIEHGNAERAKHGPEVFSEVWLAARRKERPVPLVVVPDIRFQAEVNAAVTLAGTNNCLLVHVSRYGHSWKGDLGSYCDHDWTCTLINNYKLEDLGAAMLRLYENWTAPI